MWSIAWSGTRRCCLSERPTCGSTVVSGPSVRSQRAAGPQHRIRAVQEAAGVTGNDVVTAVVSGVLRRWLLDRGELPKQSLVAFCPITVRDRERDAANDQHGNMFGLWLCPLGTNLD